MSAQDFFDRLPSRIVEHLPCGTAMRLKLLQHGLHIARKAQTWSTVEDIPDLGEIRTVRFALPSPVHEELREIIEECSQPRRIVTAVAFHHALTDQLSPGGYSAAYSKLVMERSIAHLRKT
jgi:hypothetical protein